MSFPFCALISVKSVFNLLLSISLFYFYWGFHARVVPKTFQLLYFSGLLSTQFFWQHQKKLDVTSHLVMACNGKIVLDISLEQRSFTLKFLSDYKPLIDAAYAHITTTSVFSESISTRFVWSYAFILGFENNIVESTSK